MPLQGNITIGFTVNKLSILTFFPKDLICSQVQNFRSTLMHPN
uniref:Uncharacterized protein n=1 Tax=Anguilla anguilla TaxID=7936 RepID=A0A0E9USS5_ANGAN